MNESMHLVEQQVLPNTESVNSTGVYAPHKLATQTHRLSQKGMDALVEIMPTAVFMCDSEGLITYYNQRAAELWGRLPKLNDPEDRYCGSFRIYQPDGSLLPHDQCPMAIAVRTGRGARHEVIHILRPDGATIVASVNIDPLYDEAGRRIGAVNAFEDITQRIQTEEALRQSRDLLERRVAERTAQLEQRNRELDRFAYIASHDLRSPLRGIAFLSQWVYDDCAEILPAASKEHLLKLRARAQRMERLLDDLLAYSRADRQYSAPEVVDSGLLVQELTELLGVPAGFAVTMASPMPVLTTERALLEQVLRSLLENALKHHHQPETGRVQVAAHQRDAKTEFTVTDNGPGIDPVYHERIFQVFQTLQPRDKVEGSGMGLAIVKKIVEHQGGRAWVTSNLGEGATFHFTWPKNSAG